MSLWKRRRIAEFEELEYEPLTVLEVLTEMKDLSELMVDLAYSALVLDSDPIGEEVEELAKRMDWLKYQLRIMGSLGVRTTDEAEQVSGILQIGDASEHIANAASDMVEILDANIKLRPFLGKVLEDADDRVGTLRVPDNCHASGQSFGELQIESETGVKILAIKRGKRWVYRPGADNKFQDNDLLLIRGQQEGAIHLQAWLAGEAQEKRRERTPPAAAEHTDVEELILDMKDTSELMVDLAYSSVFYDSQGIAKEVLELEEDVGEQLTELQRTCLQAVKDDALTIDHAMVMLRVAQASEDIANSALEIADIVLRDVEMHPILMAAIQQSDSAITKVKTGPGSSLLGKSLRALELESETGMRILAAKRRGRWLTGVDGEFVPEADDLLIAAGPIEAEEAFLAMADPEGEGR